MKVLSFSAGLAARGFASPGGILDKSSASRAIACVR
jgi:hypothetical protein